MERKTLATERIIRGRKTILLQYSLPDSETAYFLIRWHEARSADTFTKSDDFARLIVQVHRWKDRLKNSTVDHIYIYVLVWTK